jgi:hypothetical protein
VKRPSLHVSRFTFHVLFPRPGGGGFGAAVRDLPREVRKAGRGHGVLRGLAGPGRDEDDAALEAAEAPAGRNYTAGRPRGFVGELVEAHGGLVAERAEGCRRAGERPILAAHNALAIEGGAHGEKQKSGKQKAEIRSHSGAKQKLRKQKAAGEKQKSGKQKAEISRGAMPAARLRISAFCFLNFCFVSEWSKVSG